MKTKLRQISREQILDVLFLMGVFGFILLWAVTAPFDASPDESMKYQIIDYIMDHGSLPDGRDPSIRNANWGISYAFNPYIPYIIGAWLGNLIKIFTDSFTAVIYGARLVNVILGTLTAWFTLKIGKRLFSKDAARFMAVLVAFLPGFVFVNSYINTDAMAVFSASWIVYCWVKGMQDGWSTKVCVELAAALSVCTLSYYNAYGYLLCSALFFVGMMCKCQKKQWDYQQMIKKGLLILGIVCLLAGWWFIRSAILYDGDFLGMKTSSLYSEMYAIEELKPSNRETPYEMGMSLMGMMLWIPGAWEHNWLITVASSFVGTFGYMEIFIPYTWTKGYFAVFAAGALGVCFTWKKHFRVSVERVSRQIVPDGEDKKIIFTFKKNKVWNAENWMRICLALAGLIPCLLLLYYAYCSDFQAQGRYIMPGILPLMYFVTLGMDEMLKKFIRNEKIRSWCYRILSLGWIVSAVLVYQFVFAASYR